MQMLQKEKKLLDNVPYIKFFFFKKCSHKERLKINVNKRTRTTIIQLFFEKNLINFSFILD